ncbi:MAG: dihydrodipicolinate synthase family protein [Dehalococcoidia bacterium]
MKTYSRFEAKDYAKEHLNGVWGAATCPFFPDGTLDEAGFRANLRHWIDVLHIDGMFVGGLMNEFWSLTMKDRKRLFEITVEECKDDMQTLLAVCDYNIYDALELTEYAEELGGHFAIIMNPRFYGPQRPSDDKIFEYYNYIAERVDIPICVFNQAMMVGYAMSPEVVARLAEIPNVVGIKNAVSDPVHTLEVRRLCGDKIMVSDPDETNWLHNHTVHKQRALMSCPQVFLLQSREWQPIRDYTMLADHGDTHKATEVAASLEPARRALKAAFESVSPDKDRTVMKYWQELLGQVGGCIRPPLSELSPQEKDVIRQHFEASGLLKKAKATA